MTLETRLTTAFVRVAQEVNAVRTERGDLLSLTTTDKTSIVAALNEVVASITGAATIDDITPSTGTVFSSIETLARIQSTIDALVAGAPAALDTLNELAQAIQDNDTDLTGILTALTKRVRVDAVQVFTAAEQLQARNNIGAVASDDVGNTDRDFVADFDSALT